MIQDFQNFMEEGDKLYLMTSEEYDDVTRRLNDGDIIHVDHCPYAYFHHVQQGLIDGVLKYSYEVSVMLPFKDVTRYDPKVSSPD